MLCHADFAERRIFARVAGLSTHRFASAAAATVGASPRSSSPNRLFLRSPGMAWRGAAARYGDTGPPDFDACAAAGGVDPDDPSPARAVLYAEIVSRLTRREAERFTLNVGYAQDRLRGSPRAVLALEGYATVTVPFEELSPMAQMAFIAEIERHEEMYPHLRTDRRRPEAMWATVRRSRTDRDGNLLARCSVTTGQAGGKGLLRF
ncbi:MAG TPA: hypothetical protein QGH10_12265 [Armatimonadota bacterium]|nr:hypothetical protein [Armatimonadota bacterium]